VRAALRLLSLLVVCAFAYGFQQSTDSTELAKDKDVYAIYSLALTELKTSHGPDNDERYLIASTTTVRGFPKLSCVRPPKERETDFQEAVVDYENRKLTPRELKPALSIAKPYVLIDANEAAEFRAARSPSRIRKPTPDARFEGMTDLVSLSDVYFNQSRTLAVTGIYLWCNQLCALWQWKVFERSDTGEWQESRWVTCSAVA
jgi:hypothetical protein